jgi:hypothetical protein
MAEDAADDEVGIADALLVQGQFVERQRGLLRLRKRLGELVEDGEDRPAPRRGTDTTTPRKLP